MFTSTRSNSRKKAVQTGGKKGVDRSVASSENDTVTMTGSKIPPKPFSSSSKGNANALNKVKSGYVSKKALTPHAKSSVNVISTSEKQLQTDNDNPALAIVTGDIPSLEYWKALAEEREKKIKELEAEKAKLREQNEGFCTEIENLKEQNTLLQEENSTLESMLEDAKRLAEFVQNLPEADPDSSIEEDEDETD